MIKLRIFFENAIETQTERMFFDFFTFVYSHKEKPKTITLAFLKQHA